MKFGRIFLLLALFFLFLTPVTVLQIRAPRENRVVWMGRIYPGDGIETVYLHSVEKSPVHEYFRIGENLSFDLKETTFSSCNTGLPCAVAGKERFIDDGGTFRVTDMNRVLPKLCLWVHEDYGNVLKIGSRLLIDLPSLAGNTLLEITLRRMPLVLWGGEEVRLFIQRP